MKSTYTQNFEISGIAGKITVHMNQVETFNQYNPSTHESDPARRYVHIIEAEIEGTTFAQDKVYDESAVLIRVKEIKAEMTAHMNYLIAQKDKPTFEDKLRNLGFI